MIFLISQNKTQVNFSSIVLEVTFNYLLEPLEKAEKC